MDSMTLDEIREYLLNNKFLFSIGPWGQSRDGANEIMCVSVRRYSDGRMEKGSYISIDPFNSKITEGAERGSNGGVDIPEGLRNYIIEGLKEYAENPLYTPNSLNDIRNISKQVRKKLDSISSA
ncbi:MAG: hypothetical protein HZB67_04025 [Candidatus Aenigmarchaeota archaeon]|nr:hypothetical protein [Candidatus Aenigmarchaeota archaeon]